MKKDAEYWIRKLKLVKHPEGGYFREIYRSEENLGRGYLPRRFKGSRSLATSIYYLLKEDQFSAFHRLKTDEIWHFYAGSSLTLYVLRKGSLRQIKLGFNFENGETFQAVVGAHQWFAAKVNHPGSYALVGCSLAPGFDPRDFEFASAKQLLRDYSKYRNRIQKFIRSS